MLQMKMYIINWKNWGLMWGRELLRGIFLYITSYQIISFLIIFHLFLYLSFYFSLSLYLFLYFSVLLYQSSSLRHDRYTMDHQRFQDTLEIIKFICKEFWQLVYKKQVDNLRTNHKGVYVLNDNKFRPLLHVSMDAPPPSLPSATPTATPPSVQATGGKCTFSFSFCLHYFLCMITHFYIGKEIASLYVTFPCGLIRGALQALAVTAVVTADVSNLPSASFTIKVKL